MLFHLLQRLLIEPVLKFWYKPTEADLYLRGYIAGREYMREEKNMDIFWAHKHTFKYDAFDRGWDDGVRFILAQKETTDD